MGNCLVTKLKGTVQNDNLLKLDEFKIQYGGGTAQNQNLIALYWEPTTTGVCSVRVLGSTFEGGGTYTECNKGQDVSLRVVSGVPCEIVIGNKYDLRVLDFNVNSSMSLRLSDVKYLPHLSRGSYWRAYDSTFEDLVTLFGNGHFDSISFLGYSTFTGDITQIPAGKNFESSIIMEYTGLSGDLPTLINKIGYIANGGCGVGGSPAIIGDLSTINVDTLLCLTCNSGNTFTWKTTRSSERKIIAFAGGCNFGGDLDAMLINQANCQIGYTGHEGDDRYIQINANGTRTSASDAAVAALKTKGYSVTINEETL